MVVRKTRSRVVWFRLSSDEYEDLCSLCDSTGARSVSDLARAAVCQLMAEGNLFQEHSLAGRMRTLYVNMQELALKIEHLAAMLATGRAHESSNSGGHSA